MNTTAHSAGRVCFPSRHHAVRALCANRWPGDGTRSQWWPGKREHRGLERLRELMVGATTTRTDVQLARGDR